MDCKRFVSISHEKLVQKQRWARDGCSAGLELAQDKAIPLGSATLPSLHNTELESVDQFHLT